ncbi:WcaI family glycosyltransferase [Pontibacter sp. SGAir0037]|uniref:WcaI family glycosyltransferase n=1 Tax=Pontibacter sp. SGAir0037 TaxID=2571030 RepID=UPI0010CD3086|nr:WcaI family glycosyltransferase [Pontibacter sp. SGAir0037]QCR22589.1 colanic acid biosynthesis glycosyltransferase WcaI [Pontibacter sp. SGAir0037]
MKKSILLIGYNYYPEPTGIGKYSGEQINWLAKKGYDCTVITSYPYYPYWKVQEPYLRDRYRYKKEMQYYNSGGKVTIHRCPMFVPAKPSGLKRMLLDLSFIIAAFIQILPLLFKKKFDFIIAVSPSFLIGLLGLLCKQFTKAKILYHVHDLQIEAARDLGMLKAPGLINKLFKIERYIINSCDFITCVGEGMAQKTREKTHKEVSLFLNATDLTQFYPIKDRARLKESFGFNPTDKIILYSGAIGEKQGIENILHAANKFVQTSNMKFVICGSGPYKEKLQLLAEDLKLNNVIFFPLQPIEKFNQFLNMADLHLVVQKANAGDLVMPSKLTTVLAIGGLALVTANKGSSMYSLIKQYNMGVLVEAENRQQLFDGIEVAINKDLSYMSRNARLYSEKYLSIDKIMSNFEESYMLPGPYEARPVFENENTTIPLPA